MLIRQLLVPFSNARPQMRRLTRMLFASIPLAFVVTAHDVLAQTADTIRWAPFPLTVGGSNLDAQLGRLKVPQRRIAGRNSGATIDLAFVRLQSKQRGKGAPIVYLTGGPGQDAISTTRFAPGMAVFAELAKTGDVIFLDQRGTGMTTPRPVCVPKVLLQPNERFPVGITPDVRAAAVTERVRACVDEWKGKDLDALAFSNRESAADVEDIRRALGVPKVSLYGFSYGTHLALDVIHDFPNSIERAVLIGTAGPDDLRKLPSISDLQIEKLSLLAAQSPAIGRDVPDMRALMHRVLTKLDTQPIALTVFDRSKKEDVQVQVNGDALRSFILSDLGDGTDVIAFPALFLTIERGDPSVLAWFAEKRYNETTGAISLMPFAMRCSSGASVELEQRRRTEILTSPLRNAMNTVFPQVCDAFPGLDNGDSYRKPWSSTVPVLFISGTIDNNTPPYQAEKLRWGMPNARHIIVQNAGHEDMEPIEAVQQAMMEWFRGKDVSDRSIVLPTPRFLSVEEAKKERKRAGR